MNIQNSIYDNINLYSKNFLLNSSNSLGLTDPPTLTIYSPPFLNVVLRSIFNNSWTHLSLLNNNNDYSATPLQQNGDIFVHIENAVVDNDREYINPSDNGPYDMTWWKSHGYNEEKGNEIAKVAKNKYHSLADDEKGTSNCVGIVRCVINKVNKTEYKEFGKACNVGKEYLVNDSHFKKIVVDMSQIKGSEIPAGAIVLYPPGYSRGKGSTCGHGEISDGKGHGYSDVYTTLLQNSRNKQNGTIRKDPCEIWIPI